MRNLLIAFMSLTFLYALEAAMVGETKNHQACYLELVEDWHGFCDKGRGSESCSYSPPIGWAIKTYKPVITGYNNGKYKVTKNTSTQNNLVSEELSDSIFKTLMSSSKLDNDGLADVAALMGEYIALRKIVPENGTVSFDTKAETEAHGACWDRKRGWIHGYVEVEEVYLGQNYQDIIDWILINSKELGMIVDKMKCDNNGCTMDG